MGAEEDQIIMKNGGFVKVKKGIISIEKIVMMLKKVTFIKLTACKKGRV